MDAELPKRISLKLLVDRKTNRVVFAEADNDFVDILLSFLTLPVGTVIRLLSRKSQQLELGCVHNLYKSVENLEGKHFCSDVCKTMLLHTRNSSADICRKLKVNIDDTVPIKYYICPSVSNVHVPGGLLSTFCHGRCDCGEKLTKEMLLNQPADTTDEENGVFLIARGSFIVTDDLQIMPLSAETTVGLLNNHGASAEALEVKAIDFSQEEATRLLRHMLSSKTSLTDTFLLKETDVSSKPRFEGTPKFYSAKREEISDVQKISLNVIAQKSNGKVICAEAGGDFVSFLMSMLTFPLGAVVELLDGNPALRSISTLYKCVQGSNIDEYVRSKDYKEMLLSPKLAHQYSCKYQILDIVEAPSPSYFYNYSYSRYYYTTATSLTTTKLYSCSNSDMYSRELNLLKIEGFVRGPTTFMVTDDLVVTPFSSMSVFTMLQQRKVPLDDVKQQVISIGYTEALQILGAAMTSNTVLTTVFGSITGKNPLAGLMCPKTEKNPSAGVM